MAKHSAPAHKGKKPMPMKPMPMKPMPMKPMHPEHHAEAHGKAATKAKRK